MSNRKRISNTFVVNTVEDGKSIATVLLSPNSVYFDADSWGYAINDNDRFKVNYEMRVGDELIPYNKITVENVTYDGDGRIYYNNKDFDDKVKDNYDSEIAWNNVKNGNLYFHIIKSRSPHVNGILRVTLSCTYNGIEYTAVGECNVLPNKQGSAGKMFYYAGVWEDLLDNPNTALVVTSQQAPFVSYTHEKNPNVKLFAIFDAPPSNYTISFIVNNLRMVDNNYLPDTSKDGTYWKLMENNFTYLITKAIFGDFAKFGSAIISGDWMISQYGTIYDVNGTSHAINASQEWYDEGNDITYTFDNAYTLFLSDFPNSSKSDVINFCPNYCVDLKAGKTYQNEGIFSGFVKKKKVVLTDDNINDYSRTAAGTSDYLIDLDAAGSFLEIKLSVDIQLILPLLCWYHSPSNPNHMDGITQEWADNIRAFIGSIVIIYNTSDKVITIITKRHVTGSVYGQVVLLPNQCVQLECTMGFDIVQQSDIERSPTLYPSKEGVYENIYWYSILTGNTQSINIV